MAVQRSSTVAARARAASRERRTGVLAARRRREQRMDELADAHAIALAMVDEVRAHAEREIAGHLTAADRLVVELLELGEGPEAVAELLGVTAGEVRAARRRARGQKVDGDSEDARLDGEPDHGQGSGAPGGAHEVPQIAPRAGKAAPGGA